MHQFPHHYSVSATAGTDTLVTLYAAGVESISSAPPAEFDGPGDQWSPESLLVAAVADCFILSFRAIARASRLDWQTLSCDVDGALDRTDGGLRFTGFTVKASVTIANEDDRDKAEKLMQKAEKTCLITNSLIADSHLEAEVQVSS